jgi:acyl-coenzyme A thioesterase PaaI-like protein
VSGGADRPISAARLAAELGTSLPTAESIPPAAFALVRNVRDLVEAVVMTDAAEAELAAAAESVAAITADLRSRRRPEALLLVRHPDGRVESMVQAGSGRLNPQAPPVEWLVRPTEPPAGSEPVPTEIVARCTFTAAHAGSPGRVYGGVLALVLDEVLGVAVHAAGASGMTVSMTVTLKGATPLYRPVSIVGRYAGRDGRKSYATGEVTVDGIPAAEARAIYVRERRPDDDRGRVR